MLQVARMSLRFGGLLVLPLMVMASAAEAQEVAAAQSAAAECVARVQPERVATQADPVVLRAVYSESIGKVLSALADDKSGIKVVEVKPVAEEMGGEPMVSVQLDLSNAVAGEWTLSLQGESGKCTGKVVIQAAESRSR